MTRLGALFGGPVLLAALLRARVRIAAPRRSSLRARGASAGRSRRRSATSPESLGDPSTERSYYEPLDALACARTAAQRDRIEIPYTFNHWETAYVAPDFSLARGWLRQLDRERNELFYDGAA